MKGKKLLVLLLVLGLAGGGIFAVQDLLIKGVVLDAVAIDVVGNTTSQALNPEISQTNIKIADVTVNSNIAGYYIYAFSANAGILQTDPVVIGEQIPYSIKLILTDTATATGISAGYAQITALDSPSAILLFSGSSKVISQTDYEIQIQYTGVPNLSPGEYTDTLTLTIAKN